MIILMNMVMMIMLMVPLLDEYTVQGGIYIFQLIDWFFAAYAAIVVVLAECVCLAWVYGELIIIILLKRISREPIYHTRWQHSCVGVASEYGELCGRGLGVWWDERAWFGCMMSEEWA